MILPPSKNFAKDPTDPLYQQSDFPPSYGAVQAERRGYDRTPPFHLQAPPVPRSSSTSPTDPLTPNRMMEYPEPSPLYLDPITGRPRPTYMASDALVAQCARHGHVQRTRFGTLSIVLAAVLFPVGLLFLRRSRVVYCERCGLVLQGSRRGKIAH